MKRGKRLSVILNGQEEFIIQKAIERIRDSCFNNARNVIRNVFRENKNKIFANNDTVTICHETKIILPIGDIKNMIKRYIKNK